MQAQRTGAIRFVAGFILWLAVLAVVFDLTRSWWVTGYMRPVTAAAAGGLRWLGQPASLAQVDYVDGVCLLAVEEVVYRVTFECTGIFALFLVTASILAFPARISERVNGVLMAVPAFTAYSILRMVVLGLVAHFSPHHIELFHLYVMVVANVGFAVALWLYWTQDLDMSAKSL
jgi:exosortase/archaeosortase family protein